MTPLCIYQRALNVVSQAVLSGDFATYLTMIDLPYLLQTERTSLVLTVPEDLRCTFDMIHHGLRKRGVTHYERVARDADIVGKDRIEGRHYTNMIADGQRIAAPHLSYQNLVRRGTIWRFSEARYPFDSTEWPWTESTVFGATENTLQLAGHR